MGQKIKPLKFVNIESKEDRKDIPEYQGLTAEDIETLNANLEYLNLKFESLPEVITASFRKVLQENPGFKSLQSINSLLERIDSNLEDIMDYVSLYEAREVCRQLVILRNIMNILPGDLHNFIDRKFEFMMEEMHRPKGNLSCFRPPLKDLRFKSKLKYFLFTLPLWWLKTDKVKTFFKQMGVIFLSICTAILLFLVIYQANENRHQRRENQLLQQIELNKTTAPEGFQGN